MMTPAIRLFCIVLIDLLAFAVAGWTGFFLCAAGGLVDAFTLTEWKAS